MVAAVGPGMRFGRLTVLYDTGRCNQAEHQRIWRCRCDCGAVADKETRQLVRTPSPQCDRWDHDVLGRRYGRLTVLSHRRVDRHGISVYACRCDCGAVVDKTLTSLRKGASPQCGHWDHAILGRRYGRLKVLAYSGTAGDGTALYECRCDCGNAAVVSGHALKRGNTRSCGCGELEAGTRNVHAWHESQHVDDTLLYQLSDKPYGNSSSGIRGVGRYSRDKSKWRARIAFRRRSYSLGVYDTVEEAWRARRAAERALYDIERMEHGLDPIDEAEAGRRLRAAVRAIREGRGDE
jgi:hypothetical protein